MLFLPIFINLQQEQELGADSFVQFVIGLNLGLMAIQTFREWLNSSWRQLEVKIAASHANLLDTLQRAGHANAPELSDRAHGNVSDRCMVSIKWWQRRIWLGCSWLAGLSLLAGLYCLYFDQYCAWDALLLLPWPLFWVLSRAVCFSLLWGVHREYKTLGNCLAHPANPSTASILKQVEEAVKPPKPRKKPPGEK